MLPAVKAITAAPSTLIPAPLGEGRGHLARGSTGVCLALVVLSDLICSGGLGTWSKQWVGLFTSDEAVTRSAVAAMPMLVLSILLDG